MAFMLMCVYIEPDFTVFGTDGAFSKFNVYIRWVREGLQLTFTKGK